MGCAWPAEGNTSEGGGWFAIREKAAIMGHPLSTHNSTVAAKAACERNSQCFLLYQCGGMCDPHTNWTVALFGGGAAGALSNSSGECICFIYR